MRYSLSQGALCTVLLAPALAVGTYAPTAAAAGDPEIAQLRSMLDQLKTQYERRIADLESRLAQAERQAARSARESESAAARAAEAVAVARAESRPMGPTVASPGTPVPASDPSSHPASARGGALGALTSGSAFNPQISVILDGNYYQDGIDGEGSVLVGEAYQPSRVAPHTHEGEAEVESEAHAHGAAENGFNFREAEIAFSATVDPYFDASLMLAVDGDGEVELEEGWFQTRGLPYGLRLKGGKFLSDFGYINKQHPHQWDFVDQNLPYLNLLGPHGLQDTGVQLVWLPRLPIYALFGAELAQGNQEVFGATLDSAVQEELGLGDNQDGPRLWTAFAKLAPDLGDRHALQFGVSFAHNNQHQEIQTHTHPAGPDLQAEDDEHAAEDAGHDHAEVQAEVQAETVADADAGVTIHENGLAGDADLWGLDIVYKYSAGRTEGQGDFKLQAEYLRSIKDLEVRSSPHPEAVGTGATLTTDGLYAQAIYGFAPRWSAGLRYDVLGLVNQASGPRQDQDFGSSDRWTLDLTWSLSELSRLRAQYARNDILVEPGERERFDAFYLQFLMSLGSHGAHVF